MNNLPGNSKSRFYLLVLGMLALALVTLVVIQSCATSNPDSDRGAGKGAQAIQLEPAPKVGHLAPDFVLKDLDGNTIRLSDLRGKMVFINFWATWCPPCRAEMPEIEAVHQEYKDKGVVVLGVDISEPESTVRQYVQQGGFSWPIVLDSTGKVARDYQIAAIPTSFFLDREGVIRAVNVGAMTSRAMEEKLAEAM
jgi:thiol-disulfide isomerase/thioredoxin